MAGQERDQNRFDELVARASQGEKGAFFELLDRTAPYIRWLAKKRRRFAGIHRWADMEQDLNVKLLMLFQASPAKLGCANWLPFVTLLAKRLWIDADRKQERRPADRLDSGVADGLDAETSTPSVKAMRAEDAVRLAAAIEQLSDSLRMVAELRLIRLWSLEEIAGTLGTSREAVAVASSRAVKKLKALLESGV